MAYADQQNIINIWGEKFLADLIVAGADKDETVFATLEQAAGKMDVPLSACCKTAIKNRRLAEEKIVLDGPCRMEKKHRRDIRYHASTALYWPFRGHRDEIVEVTEDWLRRLIQ